MWKRRNFEILLVSFVRKISKVHSFISFRFIFYFRSLFNSSHKIIKIRKDQEKEENSLCYRRNYCNVWKHISMWATLSSIKTSESFLRSRVTDQCLQATLRFISTKKFKPNIKKLADAKRCQLSSQEENWF